MILEHPVPDSYQVDDYDFHFANGVTMSFAIARSLGDTVDFDTTPMAVRLHFAGKPSPIDNETNLIPEDVTILMRHIILVAHRTRTVTPPTFEEKNLFKQTVHQLSTSVN